MLFTKLNDLAKRAGGGLTLTIAQADEPDKMTVVVMPKTNSGDADPAMTMPLVLTATPTEFDEGFIDALTRYDAGRKSLAEQIEATDEVLKAARAAQAQKGAKAVSKAAHGKPAAVAPAKAGGPEADDAGDDGAGGSNGKDDDESAPTQVEQPAATGTGDGVPNLFG